MPSVGMRRTTRVFGARVLRSGRRVWTGSRERKQMKTTNGEEWIDLLEATGGGGHAPDWKENGLQQADVPADQEFIDMDVEEKAVESESQELVHCGSSGDNSVVKMFTNVYRRKRKVDSNCFDVSVSGEDTSTLEDKMCGRTYSRKLWSKKWTKKIRLCEIADACETLKVIVQSTCDVRHFVACLLNSVLRYMRKSRIGHNQLFQFFSSKSISQGYSSVGIHFLLDFNSSLERGVCMIIGGGDGSIPVFALDYSAVPFCFTYMHLSILLRGVRLSYILGEQGMRSEGEDDGMSISCIDLEMVHSANVSQTPQIYKSANLKVSFVNSGAAKLASRNVQVRNSRNIQKSSLRSKRRRSLSSLSSRKLNGTIASNRFDSGQRTIQLPSMAPGGRELRSFSPRTNPTGMKQVRSALVGLSRNADSTTCFANILVVESDRCYREQGAAITLEVSSKKQWYLAIKAGDTKRYSVVAEKIMRPCSCNRFTHAVIWAADNGWKLEFPDRRDWWIFKELYKECSDRNVQLPAESCIPVPGVQEVPFYVNSDVVFTRPTSYITVKEDELARALTSRAPSYDMDSDDEEWIGKFNDGFSAENDRRNILSDEIFELIIDAFERGFHCNPDDYSDETVVPSIGLNVEKRILEAVYSYWFKKRKQKRSALVRVFQYYQPRRAQLIPKSVLRKKRSFKRQRSQAGRGKQRFFLHAMAVEQDAEEKQNAIHKLEEAKAAASRSMELAIQKRQRAQQLMENADLLTYRATMALRIAELAQIAKSQSQGCAADSSKIASQPQHGAADSSQIVSQSQDDEDVFVEI